MLMYVRACTHVRGKKQNIEVVARENYNLSVLVQTECCDGHSFDDKRRDDRVGNAQVDVTQPLPVSSAVGKSARGHNSSAVKKLESKTDFIPVCRLSFL